MPGHILADRWLITCARALPIQSTIADGFSARKCGEVSVSISDKGNTETPSAVSQYRRMRYVRCQHS